MNFQHTEERRMLSDMLLRYVSEQYDFPTREAIRQSPEGFSPQKWTELTELGAVGALFPEAMGGLGGDPFDLLVVFEAAGRGLLLEPLNDALAVGMALAEGGADKHRATVADIVNGASLAALAHTEPGTHYEPALVGCTARRVPGGWVIDGSKSVVAHAARCDVFLVSARTSGAVDSENGISLFLVPAGAAGLQVRPYPTVDGSRAGDVVFDNLGVADDALVGREGEGHALLERAIGRSVFALCAEAVGAMDAARLATLEYLRTRKQFGVPIGSFQALQHRMATLLLEIEQARSAVIRAAAALDAPDRNQRERALSAAKFTASRVGVLVAEECIQMHGAIGMTWELPLAHYAKRLVMIGHRYGDEDHHLARYMALAQPA